MEQDNNPSLTEPQEVFTPIPQARGASGGVRWLGLGWDLIKERFWMWIGVIIIYFIVSLIISTILGFIPLLGPIISPFVTTVLAAGVVAIAHQQYETQRIDVDTLFVGFYNKRYLSLMGAYGISFLILLAGIILAILVSSAAMMDIFYAINSDYPEEIIAEMMVDNSSGFTLFFIIIAIFGALSTAAYWFVPALVLVNGYKALPAVKASLSAVKINLAGGFFFFILLFFINILSDNTTSEVEAASFTYIFSGILLKLKKVIKPRINIGVIITPKYFNFFILISSPPLLLYLTFPHLHSYMLY